MTRDEILDAAAQVFRQKGFHAASMADIAQAVNLKKASLYHHVTSKQEILLALLDRAIGLLIEHIEPIALGPQSAEEKLRHMIRTYLRLLAENADLAAVLLFEHRSLEPNQRARHIPTRDRFEALWRRVIVEGQTAGLFHPHDPALTARALLGIMNWTLTWYRPGGPLTIGEIADRYINLLYSGLLSRPVLPS